MLSFLPRRPPPPHSLILVSFLGFGGLPGDPGSEGAPISSRCGLGFDCCAVGRGLVLYCGVRVGKPSVKQLCNPLDADQGAPHSRRGPADWLDAGTRDWHVAVLAQPAWVSLETEWRCCWARKWGRCWSHDGRACCGEAGVGVVGGDFLLHCLKPVAFPWHRVCCHKSSQEAGASPPSPPNAAQEMDFLCFWSRVFDRRGRRGEG